MKKCMVAFACVDSDNNVLKSGLVTGVCEADCVGHSGVLPDYLDW